MKNLKNMKSMKGILGLFFLILLTASARAGAPVSSFTVSPGTTVTPGSTVCYTNTSTGTGINSYAWTFGGAAANYTGTTAGTANPPCVTYPTAGTFSTCLTVTNSSGNNQSCQTITVSDAINIGTVSGTTINNACGLLLQDNGGAGNYTNNANNTVTFCSGSAQYVRLVLSSIGLVAGDVINIYQGTGTGGTLLSTLTAAQNGATPTIFSNSTCVTIQFISDGAGVSTGFAMQALCYSQNHVIMGSGAGTPITVSNACGQTIYDPGYTGNYGNNQTYTTTICASNPAQVPQILFNNFNLTAGDVLNVYNGSNTSGSLIYDAANTDNGTNNFITPGLTISGLSQCMTLQFISNGSGVSAGFDGAITCETPPSPCSANPVAADNFDAATMICDFTQYCGVTSGFYGVDMPNIGQTSVFNGSLENNSWLMFVADGPTASFNVATSSSSCYIQIGVYSVSATEGFTWLSPASINGGFDYTNVNTGFAGSGIINAQGMVAGQTYYIMIDGHGGSVCNYTLTAGIGVQLPVALASPDMVLPCNTPGSVSVTNTNGSANVDWTWTWAGTSSGGPVSGNSVNFGTLPPGTYTFTVEASDFNSCVTNAIQDQVTVTVNPCPLGIQLDKFDVVPKGAYNQVNWSTISETGNSHFLVERSVDGVNWELIHFKEAAGNSLDEVHYLFEDYSFKQGINYYRLAQFDLNGEGRRYDMIAVDNREHEKEVLRIVNMIGQEVDESHTGPRIIQYTDGSSKKIMN
jgi:hypothetical protein